MCLKEEREDWKSFMTGNSELIPSARAEPLVDERVVVFLDNFLIGSSRRTVGRSSFALAADAGECTSVANCGKAAELP